MAWLVGWAENLHSVARGSGAAVAWWSDGTRLVNGDLGWYPESQDWLEIEIELERRSPSLRQAPGPLEPVWSMTMTLWVACWCSIDHNVHTVEARSWEVGTLEAFRQMCDKALSVVVAWASISVDPESWRQRAGLAPRPRSTDARP